MSIKLFNRVAGIGKIIRCSESRRFKVAGVEGAFVVNQYGEWAEKGEGLLNTG